VKQSRKKVPAAVFLVHVQEGQESFLAVRECEREAAEVGEHVRVAKYQLVEEGIVSAVPQYRGSK
jgi:hypothetical protein